MTASPEAPAKGSRRRAWTDVGFAALDFETTGLDLANDHVVSFGVVPVRSGRIVLGEGVHQLIRPPIEPSPSSVTIHRMRTQDLTEAPELEEAVDVLAGALAGRFLLAWYASVELALLGRIFPRAGRTLPRRCIDVRKLAIVDTGSDSQRIASLTSCAERYHVPVAAPHEAYDDALVTAQLFLVLAERLQSRGIRTVGDLLRVGR